MERSKRTKTTRAARPAPVDQNLRKPAPITRLPLEIVFDILERCDLRGRKSLAESCKWGHQVSLPVLFREIHIRRRSVDLLEKYPHLQQRLVSIILITQLAERSSKIQTLVSRFSKILPAFENLREVTISNIDTISDFRMLQGFLTTLSQIRISSLSVDFGHLPILGGFGNTAISNTTVSNMATETRATLEDFNLSFPSGLKRLNLRFETFTSHLITPVDLIPVAFGPSKDTLEFFQVSLNELTFHRIRRSGRVRTNIPRWERLYHKDLISSSLKELRFGCVTSQDVLDPQRAFLPFADIGGMWPKLEKIYYIVNGPWNNDAALQAFRHLATLTYLKELSLFSPRSYGWWNAGGTALEDMSDRVLKYGADLPHSLKVIRFYARTYPPPQGLHAQVVYKPVEVYISRNQNILEVEKTCWGTQIGNIFFPREWGYDLRERR